MYILYYTCFYQWAYWDFKKTKRYVVIHALLYGNQQMLLGKLCYKMILVMVMRRIKSKWDINSISHNRQVESMTPVNCDMDVISYHKIMNIIIDTVFGFVDLVWQYL